jgi:hypothetical protein
VPIDASIPLQSQMGSPFASMNQATQSLSSLANLQNVQQQNQMMQAETQNLQQSAELNTQLNGERTKFSQAMQDPNATFKNPDGTIDYGKMQQWTATNTPLVGSQYGSQIMQLAQHVNEYKTTLSSMADSDMQRTNAVLHSFAGPNGNPVADPQTMVGQLQALKSTLSGPGAHYVDLATQAIQKAGGNPQMLQSAITQLARDTTAPSTQTSQLQGSTGMVNNGAATYPIAQNPEYGQAPGTVTGTPAIPNQLGPGERQTSVTNPTTGNLEPQVKDLNGNIIGGPAVPNPLGPKPLAPGDTPQVMAQLGMDRQAMNDAARQAGLQRSNNAQIMQLASGDRNSGPGTAPWNKFLGTLGLANQGAGDAASQYQLLGHYVALQAQNNAAAMGVHTDAGQTLSGAATGNQEMNRTALVEATRTNDALATGVQDFNQGMEAAIKGNGGDVRAKRDFQNQWSQNFDPVLYKMKNAITAGDTAEASKIWSGLSPQQQQQMKTKQQNLLNLINNGHL